MRIIPIFWNSILGRERQGRSGKNEDEDAAAKGFIQFALLGRVFVEPRFLHIGHATGGLTDTLEDGDTGFIFSPMAAETFLTSIRRALAAYHHMHALHAIQHNAMTRDFS